MAATTGAGAGVEAVLEVLELLAGGKEFGLRELAARTHWSKTTVHRVLSTLCQLEFVSQDPESKKYRLGPSAVYLGMEIVSHLSLRALTFPVLRQLARETGCITFLGHLRRKSVFLLDRARPAGADEGLVMVPLQYPVHATSMGKAILAFLPPAERERVLSGYDFAPLGKNSIRTRDMYERELESVRSAGYALNLQELHNESFSVAVPVFTVGRVVAALAADVAGLWPNESAVDGVIRILQSASLRIGQSLASVQVSRADRAAPPGGEPAAAEKGGFGAEPPKRLEDRRRQIS